MKLEDCVTNLDKIKRFNKWFRIGYYISFSIIFLGILLGVIIQNEMVAVISLLVGAGSVFIIMFETVLLIENGLEIDKDLFRQYIIEKATEINARIEAEEVEEAEKEESK